MVAANLKITIMETIMVPFNNQHAFDFNVVSLLGLTHTIEVATAAPLSAKVWKHTTVQEALTGVLMAVMQEDQHCMPPVLL